METTLSAEMHWVISGINLIKPEIKKRANRKGLLSFFDVFSAQFLKGFIFFNAKKATTD
ncbi:MAG: hypothetical protein ACJASQ_004049 [Crocinitomicaceae bacterium]|jgi:hypothetical protein